MDRSYIYPFRKARQISQRQRQESMLHSMGNMSSLLGTAKPRDGANGANRWVPRQPRFPYVWILELEQGKDR